MERTRRVAVKINVLAPATGTHPVFSHDCMFSARTGTGGGAAPTPAAVAYPAPAAPALDEPCAAPVPAPGSITNLQRQRNPDRMDR